MRNLVAVTALLAPLLSVSAPPPVAVQQQVAGTWVLSVTLDIGGGGDATFVLSVEDSKISGTYTGQLGEDLEVTGEVTEEGVRFSFETQAGEVVYQGKIEGDKMEGTCVYGQLGPGTFAGERREQRSPGAPPSGS